MKFDFCTHIKAYSLHLASLLKLFDLCVKKSSLAPSHDFDHIVEFSLFVVDNIFDVSACIKDTNNRHATFIFIYEVKSCVVIYGNPAYSHRMPRLPLYKRMAHRHSVKRADSFSNATHLFFGCFRNLQSKTDILV